MTIQSFGATFSNTQAMDTRAVSDTQAAAQTREVAKAVQSLNQSSAVSNDRQFTLSIDPATKTPVVKFIDTTTNQVIEQFPAEYVLKLAAFLDAQEAQEKSFKQSSS